MKVNSIKNSNTNNSQSFGHCVLFKDSVSNKLKFFVTCKNPANDSFVSFFDGKDIYYIGESVEAGKLSTKLRALKDGISEKNMEGDVRELLSSVINSTIKSKLFSAVGVENGATLGKLIGDMPLKLMNEIANLGEIKCGTPTQLKGEQPANSVSALFIG